MTGRKEARVPMRQLSAMALGLGFCETSADMFLPLDRTFADWNRDQPDVQDQRVASSAASREAGDDRRTRSVRRRRLSWGWRTA
jgi:hypothetical protein